MPCYTFWLQIKWKDFYGANITMWKKESFFAYYVSWMLLQIYCSKTGKEWQWFMRPWVKVCSSCTKIWSFCDVTFVILWRLCIPFYQARASSKIHDVAICQHPFNQNVMKHINYNVHCRKFLVNFLNMQCIIKRRICRMPKMHAEI